VKVAIVGANSQVGTELTLLFDDQEDVEVVPITRNRLGTHFLRHSGIECEVADVTDDDDASRTLADVDAAVIAAFAWQYSQEGFQARGARKSNEAIVENTVRHAPADCDIVYLSSQAAYGDDIGAPQYSDWSLYTREKRNAEDVLEESCEETGQSGYALRLGFVHGPNQGRSQVLRDFLGGDDHVHVVADPEKPSNVLHTVTLRDAIVRCGQDVAPGTYPLVNEPQWTWGEVCDHYSPDGTTIHYHPPGGDPPLYKRLLGRAWGVIEDRQRTLRTATVYVPDAVNEWLFHRYLQRQRGGELSSLVDRTSLERSAFEFDPVPGENLPGLPETRSQLADLDVVREHVRPV